MGVFARLRRKSRRTVDEAGAAAEGTPALEGAEGAEAVADPVAESHGAGEGAGDGGTSAAEGADIPKQQTVEKAADNEAGEGARA